MYDQLILEKNYIPKVSAINLVAKMMKITKETDPGRLALQIQEDLIASCSPDGQRLDEGSLKRRCRKLGFVTTSDIVYTILFVQALHRGRALV